ncbi:MAG: M48 family metallopeptidase [Gemmatimonadaceae bacterium]|jgi:Zn-dependent protease with chaperone function|nr:M48 family metallopeptidase [Gemmatimonadaceae bacterium]
MARTILTDISSLSWEHPADRAALNALRAIPGFQTVVNKAASVFGERGIRHLFTANAVRVGPTQRPDLDALWTEVLQTLDWPTRPQLYVTQTPQLNAGAVGFGDPFVVINSAAIEHLNRDELRVLLAHELGHIMSGHVTYRTMAQLILIFGIGNLPFLAGIALLPFQMALLEWYRKSELSCDRASLLGVQDPDVVLTTFMKLAGGREFGDRLDLAAFKEQAKEYETDGSAWDTLLKALNTAFQAHPFFTVRAGELQRWVESGAYARALAGDYKRRADVKPGENLGADMKEASTYYADQAKAAASKVTDSLGRARSAFTDAFKGGAR